MHESSGPRVRFPTTHMSSIAPYSSRSTTVTILAPPSPGNSFRHPLRRLSTPPPPPRPRRPSPLVFACSRAAGTPSPPPRHQMVQRLSRTVPPPVFGKLAAAAAAEEIKVRGRRKRARGARKATRSRERRRRERRREMCFGELMLFGRRSAPRSGGPARGEKHEICAPATYALRDSCSLRCHDLRLVSM